MKKRMTILALLLAGAVTLGSYGMVQACLLYTSKVKRRG